MAKIRCTLPNAAEVISGIAFTRQDDGSVVSVDEVPPSQAAIFLSIEGYEEVAAKRPDDGDKAPAQSKPVPPPETPESEARTGVSGLQAAPAGAMGTAGDAPHAAPKAKPGRKTEAKGAHGGSPKGKPAAAS
jgi:hypothetical protein